MSNFLEFRCMKVRETKAGYTVKDEDGEGESRICRCFEVHFAPIAEQHDIKGAVAGLHLWLYRSCRFEEGKVYRLSLEAEMCDAAVHG